MSRGFPISASFSEAGGRVLLNDSLGNVILDNTDGRYANKTVSIKWNGYDKTNAKNIWNVQVLGESSVSSVNGKTGAVIIDVPTKTSQLTNDSGFLTEKPTYTASEVGADASGTASTKVSEHNTSETSHSDIRLLIEGLTKNKVNVSDIIDNLTTSVTNKPLSAKQGVQLKALIDAIVVPTLLSQLQGDSTHRTVTDAEKTAWNNKSDFSGSYNDLTDKPTIPEGADLTGYATETYVKDYAQPKGNYLTQHQSLEGYAKTTDHYTKTESDNKYQPKGNYLTSHQDISGKANKSDAETWTFTLTDGSTVTKKVVLA
jgi:hypothetical protein